eukprot:TRINITY_DN21715_c0_g1_i1.p1 TRINITY_DN21715_c0_g1~~TRINITY_DN21715_c0_g1_i1.p1  ORF type:complete len:532 (-),score=127.88 TRINITY_DN21715_c0_g1_i1:24-1619(-)
MSTNFFRKRKGPQVHSSQPAKPKQTPGTAPKKQSQPNQPKPSPTIRIIPQNPKDLNELLHEVKTKVKSIYKDTVDPIADDFHFKNRAATHRQPMVVFLGNHSSGKSSFINFILGQKDLQTTGQAPMDDGFTLITYGSKNDEQLGPAIVNNTKLPFAGLQSFGPQFVEHLKMKYLPCDLLKHVTVVDSPGMIDSVGEEGRGYDFAQAVAWFAERADYILFFFDGEKPGTTGESIKVFTQALTGMDHKLLILMNKVDTFRNISDFVRTYGTLCWNLAKVIPYKDMPFIYTTYIPEEGREDGSNPESGKQSWSLDEFSKAREKIIKKVRDAPSRHVDNLITELKKHGEQLLLHSQVISEVKKAVWWERLKWVLIYLFISVLALLLLLRLNFGSNSYLKRQYEEGGIVDMFLGADINTFILPLMGLLFFVIASAVWFVPASIKKKERELRKNLDEVFEKLYAKQLLDSDHKDYYESLWDVVQPTTKSTLEKFPALSFKQLTKKQKASLDEIVFNEVENMLDLVHTTIQGPDSTKV